eukprot:8528426-Ditylum_brightwellii.AAC.1
MEGSYYGIKNGSQLREFSLQEGEGIISVTAREHRYAYGMAFLSFTTTTGRIIEVAASGNAEDDGNERTFNAPHGYVLGGIHGMTGGVKGESPITMGFYWVEDNAGKDKFQNLEGFNKPAIFERGI